MLIGTKNHCITISSKKLGHPRPSPANPTFLKNEKSESALFHDGVGFCTQSEKFSPQNLNK